jgi:four helix bundle protein
MDQKYLFPFEKLRVWQGAREYVKEVYQVTSRLPSNELYGLVSQLNRAAVSVAANLAEGAARTSRKDQAHFSQLAYSSLMETACLLVLCVDLEMLAPEFEQKLRANINGLSAGINALRKSQLSA